MSSYIIDKKEYIKVAGLCAGTELAKGWDSHKWYVDNMYDMFKRCYELNVLSYGKQYNEDVTFDPNDYINYFDKYKKIGKLMQEHDKKNLLNTVMGFFRSASYQVEDMQYSQEMQSWFYVCLSHLMPRVEGYYGIVDDNILKK